MQMHSMNNLKLMNMNNYELKELTLIRWENEMLILKIAKLEKQIGELELRVRNQTTELKQLQSV